MDADMKRYLLDTNILIYYLADEIPSPQLPAIEEMLTLSFRISIITKIELLGWKKQSPEEYVQAHNFLESAEIYPLTEAIADSSINLRRSYGMSLPDAVIASTAIHHE